MKQRLLSWSLFLGAASIVSSVLFPTLLLAQTSGPLRVSTVNSRYFTDDRGKAIYLTGSHTWNSWQDWPSGHPPLDFDAYLDFLQQYKHNFLKLRVWEEMATSPLPFARTGPGDALDGAPKFNLTQFNQEFFDRLRQRAIAARDRGIFVSVMMFQWREDAHQPSNNPHFQLTNHPFHRDNNVNGIHADRNGDGKGEEMHTLGNDSLQAIQEAYVRKVVDTVNDLDNILYEISNESPSESEPWQHRMIQVIRTHEAGKKQHPIMMSLMWPGGDDSQLFASPADAISPGGHSGWTDPPQMDGAKVMLSDPDHYGYPNFMGDRYWVWKTFARGGHPIPLDVLPETLAGHNSGGYADRADQNELDAMRRAMGHTRTYAERMNLLGMVPRGDLSSTEYALANVGQEYLVYQPNSGAFSVNLSDAPGTFSVEWFNSSAGTAISAAPVTGGAMRTLSPPFDGHAVLYLRKGGSTPTPPAPVTNVRIVR